MIVVAEGAELTEAELTAYCGERLSRFKVPTVVAFETELPKDLDRQGPQGRAAQNASSNPASAEACAAASGLRGRGGAIAAKTSPTSSADIGPSWRNQV